MGISSPRVIRTGESSCGIGTRCSPLYDLVRQKKGTRLHEWETMPRGPESLLRTGLETFGHLDFAFSQDGSLLFSTSGVAWSEPLKGFLKCWRTDTGTEVFSREVSRNLVGLALLSKNELVASGIARTSTENRSAERPVSFSHFVRLWSFRTGEFHRVKQVPWCTGRG